LNTVTYFVTVPGLAAAWNVHRAKIFAHCEIKMGWSDQVRCDSGADVEEETKTLLLAIIKIRTTKPRRFEFLLANTRCFQQVF
jgi:hypothetical protein